MIKKIRITNHSEKSVRDTTIGKVYDATFHAKGSRAARGNISMKDTLCFRDDVGDKVSIWACDPVYEVVDEEEPKSSTEEDGWNTVNWDEIPDDVEAVITFEFDEPSYYKTVEGILQVQCYRSDSFECSRRREIDDVIEQFGDRFHLRPTPTSQPITEPPESTQVESSEVEAKTAPEFDWSSVADDVEAVITYKGKCKQLLKTVEGVLKYQRVGELEYITSCFYSTLDEREKCISHYRDGTAILIRRPPAITTPGVDMYDMFKGADSKPSISTILQEAQQSILKHHGVTGKVKFIVTCS